MARKSTTRAQQEAVPLEPGTVFAVPLDDGRFTALQWIRMTADHSEIVELDWLGEAPPTLADLEDARPLVLSHHSWNGRIEHRLASPAAPPATMIAIGVLSPPVLPPPGTYGGWPDGWAQIVAQREWETEIPEADRRAYKESPVKTARVALGEKARPLASGAPVAWREIAEMGRLSELEIHGDPDGLVEFLRSRPLIGQLRWAGHGRTRIDLSRTRVRELTLDVVGPLEAILPDSIRALSVEGDVKALTIRQSYEGARMGLSVIGSPELPRGLQRLKRFSANTCGVVDIGALAEAFPALASVSVHGPATRVKGIERLADLQNLRTLALYGCYELDAAKLPPASRMPRLEAVVIGGHVKDDAKQLRAAFGEVRTFELRGGKTKAWLEANLDNPFRDWIDHDARKGKRAVAAWKTARTRLSKPLESAEATAALREFVDVFNRLEAKDDIDTIEREAIADAFVALVDAAGLDRTAAMADFDAWRDF